MRLAYKLAMQKVLGSGMHSSAKLVGSVCCICLLNGLTGTIEKSGH